MSQLSQKKIPIDMTTSTLICVWGSLCAYLVYMDWQLWITFASTAFFSWIRLCVAPVIASKRKAFCAFDWMKQKLYLNTFVSLCHSVLIALILLYISCMDNSIFASNLVTSSSFSAHLALSISTGYFAYDLWDLVASKLYIKSPILIVHHTAVLICYISALYKVVGIPYLILTLFCEYNSVFLHLRKLVSMEAPSKVKENPLIWILLWFTFFFTRKFVHIGINYSVYVDKDSFPLPIYYYMAFSGMLLFNLLNVGLLVDLLAVCKKDLSKNISKIE